MHSFNKLSSASKNLSMPALIVNCLLPASHCEKHAGLVPAMIQLEEGLDSIFNLGIKSETVSLPANSCKKHAELAPAVI